MKETSRKMMMSSLVIVIIMVCLLSTYTMVLQYNYRKSLVDSAISRNTQNSNAIHRLLSNELTDDDFRTINSKKDMESERYKELQQCH